MADAMDLSGYGSRRRNFTQNARGCLEKYILHLYAESGVTCKHACCKTARVDAG